MLRIIRGHPLKGRIHSSYLYQIPITLNIVCFISSKIRKAQVKLSKNNPLSKVIKEKRSVSENVLKPKKQVTVDEGFQIVPKRNFTDFKVKKSQVNHGKTVSLNIIQEHGINIFENIMNKLSIQPNKKKKKDILIFKKKLLLERPTEEIPRQIFSNNDRVNRESISQPNIKEQSNHAKDEVIIISKPNKPLEAEDKTLPGVKLPTSTINQYKWKYIRKPKYSMNSSYLIASREKGKNSTKFSTIKKASPHQVEYNLKKLAEKYSQRRILNETSMSSTSNMKENKKAHIVNKCDEKQKIILMEKKKKMIKEIIKQTRSMKFLQKKKLEVSSPPIEMKPSKQTSLNSSPKSNTQKEHNEISKNEILKTKIYTASSKIYNDSNNDCIKNKGIKTISEPQRIEHTKYQSKIKSRTKSTTRMSNFKTNPPASNAEKANNFSHKDINDGKNCRKKDDNLNQDIKRAYSTSTEENPIIHQLNSEVAITKKEAEQFTCPDPGSAILPQRCQCNSIKELEIPLNYLEGEGRLNNMHCASGPFVDLDHLNSDLIQIKTSILKEIHDNVIFLPSSTPETIVSNKNPNTEKNHNLLSEKQIYSIFDCTFSQNNEENIKPKRNLERVSNIAKHSINEITNFKKQFIRTENELVRKFNFIEFKTKPPRNFLDLQQKLNSLLFNNIQMNMNDKWGSLTLQELKDYLGSFNGKSLEDLHLYISNTWNYGCFDALTYLLIITKLHETNNIPFYLHNSSCLPHIEKLKLENLKYIINYQSPQINSFMNFNTDGRFDPILTNKNTKENKAIATKINKSTFNSVSSIENCIMSNENKLLNETSKITDEEYDKYKLNGSRKNILHTKTENINVKNSEPQINDVIIDVIKNKCQISKLKNKFTNNFIYPKKCGEFFNPSRIIRKSTSKLNNNIPQKELLMGPEKKKPSLWVKSFTETKKLGETNKEWLPSCFNNTCDTNPNKNISEENNKSFVAEDNCGRIKLIIQHPNSNKISENISNPKMKQDHLTGSVMNHLLEDKKKNYLESEKEADPFDETKNNQYSSFNHLVYTNKNLGSENTLINKLLNKKKEKVTQDNELKDFCSVSEGITSQNQCMHYCTSNKMIEPVVRCHITNQRNNVIEKYVKQIQSSFQNDDKHAWPTYSSQHAIEENFRLKGNINSQPVSEKENFVKLQISESYFGTKYTIEPNILHKNYQMPRYGSNKKTLRELICFEKLINNPNSKTNGFKDLVKNKRKQRKMQSLNAHLLKQENSYSFEDLTKAIKNKVKTKESIINNSQSLDNMSEIEDKYFKESPIKMLLKYATYKTDKNVKLKNAHNSDFTAISEILVYEDNLFSKDKPVQKVNILETSKISEKPSSICISENDLTLIQTFIKETNIDKSKESFDCKDEPSENQSQTSRIVYLPETKQFKITNFKYSDNKITIKLPEVFIDTDARANNLHDKTQQEECNFSLKAKSPKENLDEIQELKQNVLLKECCNFLRFTDDTHQEQIKKTIVDQNINNNIHNEFDKVHQSEYYFPCLSRSTYDGNIPFCKVGLCSNNNDLSISSKSNDCKLDPSTIIERTRIREDLINDSFFLEEKLITNSKESVLINNSINKVLPFESNNQSNSANETKKARVEQQKTKAHEANVTQDIQLQKNTSKIITNMCNEDNKFLFVYSNTSEQKINCNKSTKYSGLVCKDARKTKILPEELPNQNNLLTAKINKQNHIRTISSDPTIQNSNISTEDKQSFNTNSKPLNLDYDKNKLPDYTDQHFSNNNAKTILLEDSQGKQNFTLSASLNKSNQMRDISSEPTSKRVDSINSCNIYDNIKLLNMTAKSADLDCVKCKFAEKNNQHDNIKENEILSDYKIIQNNAVTPQQHPTSPSANISPRESIDLNSDLTNGLKMRSLQSDGNSGFMIHDESVTVNKNMENNKVHGTEENLESNKTTGEMRSLNDIKNEKLKLTESINLKAEEKHQVSQSNMEWCYIPETRQLKITNLKYTNGKDTIHLPELYITVEDKILVNNNNEQLNKENAINEIRTEAEAKPSSKEKILTVEKDDTTKIKNNEITDDHLNKDESSVSVREPSNSELNALNKNTKNILISGVSQLSDKKLEETHYKNKTMRNSDIKNASYEVLPNCKSINIYDTQKLKIKNLLIDNVQVCKQNCKAIKSEIEEGERKKEMIQFPEGFSEKTDEESTNKIKLFQKNCHSAYIKDDVMYNKIEQIEELMKSVSLSKDNTCSKQKQCENAIHASIAKRAHMRPPEDDLRLSKKKIREIMKGKNSIPQTFSGSSVCQESAFKNTTVEDQKQVYRLPEIYNKQNNTVSLINNNCINSKELEQKKSKTIIKDMNNKATDKDCVEVNKPADMNFEQKIINDKIKTTFIKLGTVASSSSEESTQKKECFGFQKSGKLGLEMLDSSKPTLQLNAVKNIMSKPSNIPASEGEKFTTNIKNDEGNLLNEQLPINNAVNSISTPNKNECNLNNNKSNNSPPQMETEGKNEANTSSIVRNNVPYKVIEKEMNIDKSEQNFGVFDENDKMNNTSVSNCNISNLNRHILCHIPLPAVNNVASQIKKNNGNALQIDAKEDKKKEFDDESKNKIKLPKKSNDNLYPVKHNPQKYYKSKTEKDFVRPVIKVKLSAENISKFPKNNSMPDHLVGKINKYKQKPILKISEYDKVQPKNTTYKSITQHYSKTSVDMNPNFKETKITKFPEAKQNKNNAKKVVEMRMKTLKKSKDAMQKLLSENSRPTISKRKDHLAPLENSSNYSMARSKFNFISPGEINLKENKSHIMAKNHGGTETYSDSETELIKHSNNNSDLSASSTPAYKETVNNKSNELSMYISNNTFHNLQAQLNEGTCLGSTYFSPKNNINFMKNKPQKTEIEHSTKSMPRYQNLNSSQEEENLRESSEPALIMENMLYSMKAKLQELPSSMNSLILQKHWTCLPREVIYEHPQSSKSEVFKTKADKICQHNIIENKSMDSSPETASIKYENKYWISNGVDDSLKKVKEKINYNKSQKKIENRLQSNSMYNNNRKQNPHSSYSDLLSNLYSKYINNQ